MGFVSDYDLIGYGYVLSSSIPYPLRNQVTGTQIERSSLFVSRRIRSRRHLLVWTITLCCSLNLHLFSSLTMSVGTLVIHGKARYAIVTKSGSERN